jgi:protein-ribulosamine 3-kinase
MISRSLIASVEQIIHSPVISHQTVSGGSINAAFRIKTADQTFFLKYNDTKKFPGMFEAEAKGLQTLQRTNTFMVPDVIATGEEGGKSFLLLNWIENGERKKLFAQDFGKRLARLHRNSSSDFGLGYNNFIGSLPQSNLQHKSWIEFFIAERLEKQLASAKDSGIIDGFTSKQFEKLYIRLPEFIPEEPPALIHGDLWNGNYMVAPDGSACLVDPAIYFGHREMDLAMSRLFGGFPEEFYDAYHESFPLQPGFDNRFEIHNLYPLLVHVNLFGGGYLQQVKSILSRF